MVIILDYFLMEYKKYVMNLNKKYNNGVRVALRITGMFMLRRRWRLGLRFG